MKFWSKQEWAIVLLFFGLICAVVGGPWWAKNEVCKTYYPEMNRVACWLSSYGMPMKAGK